MPDDVEAQRRENLARLVDAVGSQAALARRCGVSKQQISSVLSGHKKFGERAARKVEKSLALAPGSLDDAGQTPLLPVVSSGSNEPIVPKSERITALEVRKEYALAEPIKVSKIRLIEFDGEWLYEQKIDTAEPNALRLMSVSSDSMEPEILKGATVVIDVSQRQLLANGIFAMAYSGAIFIHRVQVLPGNKYLLLSDNPRYQPVTLDKLDGIVIIGRVVLINNTHGA